MNGEKEGLYPIGVLAKIVHISIDTLRYYDVRVKFGLKNSERTDRDSICPFTYFSITYTSQKFRYTVNSNYFK